MKSAPAKHRFDLSVSFCNVNISVWEKYFYFCRDYIKEVRYD